MDDVGLEQALAPGAGRVEHRLHLPLLAGILGVGLFLRLHGIGSDGLWIDEAFSIWLSQCPLREMVYWVQTVDHHPPLYYVALRGWTTVFGTAEGAARSLSALLSTLTIVAVYDIGRGLKNMNVGLIAALVLTLSPFHIRFAQEARMYAMLAFFASLALAAFVRLQRDPSRSSERDDDVSQLSHISSRFRGLWRLNRFPWIVYVGSTAAMLWTHNTAIFFPLAANLIVLLRVSAPTAARASQTEGDWAGVPGGSAWLRRWGVAQAAVLILWLPWLPSLLLQALDVHRRFWLAPPSVGTVLSILGAFLWDFVSAPIAASIVVNIALVGLVIIGALQLRRRRGGGMYIGLFVLVPLLGQWLVSAWRPILYARTLIWISIPLYLLLACGVWWLGVRSVAWVPPRALSLFILTILVVLEGAASYAYFDEFEKEAWDEAVDLVTERMQPGDLLLFHDAWGQIPFDYYLGRTYNPEQEPDVTVHGVPVDLFGRGVLEPEMTEADLPRLARLVTGHRRVWLIYSHHWYTDPDGLVPEALAKTLDLDRHWSFRGLEVLLYREE